MEDITSAVALAQTLKYQVSVVQAAALRAFGLSQVQSTPALRQSAMQLSLGMDVSRGLNLDSWQYGSEGPSVSMVLEAMDCRVSATSSQSAMPQNLRPGSNSEVACCFPALHRASWLSKAEEIASNRRQLCTTNLSS